jgi:simple sugar transport system permease protein
VFFTRIDLINLSQIAAPIMIIAYGEVLLLICGEIDLSVGFALVGIQIAFQTQVIDTFSGGAGYQSMFYAVAAAVIGGTAMLGGSGTMIGAFLGAAVLTILTDGFEVIGVSAYPLEIFFGGAILLSMIVNVQFARLRGEGRAR